MILVTRFNKIYNKYFFEIAVAVMSSNEHHTIWTVKSCQGQSFVLETSHLNTTWPYGLNIRRYVQDSQNFTGAKYILPEWGKMSGYQRFPIESHGVKVPLLKKTVFVLTF